MFKEYVKKCTINYFEKIKTHGNTLVRSIPYENCKKKHKRIMHILN